ncbi:MAG TPA: PIN domain-containing protein [Thermodesulfobacteriota bacterium]|nr:PIN domain-containing protein [Thermodesulfobacteriota bacterium]
MSENRVFVHTNVLVYAYDIDAGGKHQIALEIMKDLWVSGRGILSTQTLQEFFVTVTGKIPSPLTASEAEEILKRLARWDVITNNTETVFAAIELHKKYKFSFWDSLIIASALEGGARTLLSEDLSDKQKLEGIVITNPFKA